MNAHAPLTRDACLLLGEGVRDPRAERLPDGPRHYRAVHELLACGFSAYGKHCLEVTDAGRAYYAQGVPPESLPPEPPQRASAVMGGPDDPTPEGAEMRQREEAERDTIRVGGQPYDVNELPAELLTAKGRRKL